MIDSFQNGIKNVLFNLNNNDFSTIKEKYNNIYGENGYDELISELNSIENNYMVDGKYDKDKMNKVSNKITKFYITQVDDEVKAKKLDLRAKEALLETFQSHMNDLINSYDERIELDELQNKRKY